MRRGIETVFPFRGENVRFISEVLARINDNQVELQCLRTADHLRRRPRELELCCRSLLERGGQCRLICLRGEVRGRREVCP